MKIKNIVLFGSLIGIVVMIVSMNSVDVGFCVESNRDCRHTFDFIERVLYLSIFVLPFSLLTLKMKDSVFNSWWKFARIAIPVILVVSILINLRLHHSPGGFLNLDDLLDIPIHIFMYAVFVLGSVVQIYRGWKS